MKVAQADKEETPWIASHGHHNKSQNKVIGWSLNV